jgi:hypothetical protein
LITSTEQSAQVAIDFRNAANAFLDCRAGTGGGGTAALFRCNAYWAAFGRIAALD